MTLTLQSWMAPTVLILIGLILVFSSKWEGQYVQLPGDEYVAGIVLLIFGFGMLFGVFLT